jgi:hypothetical protein
LHQADGVVGLWVKMVGDEFVVAFQTGFVRSKQDTFFEAGFTDNPDIFAVLRSVRNG